MISLACDCCASAKENPTWHTFTPSCIHCGARLIKRLGTLPILRSECTTRRKAALETWVKWGHSETELRRLVKVGPWIEETKK